jgi:hypothetical protein
VTHFWPPDSALRAFGLPVKDLNIRRRRFRPAASFEVRVLYV